MEVTARPAATLVIARDGVADIEVLMVHRPPRGYFGDLWVFPGGAVDPVDDSDVATEAVGLPDDCDDGPWRCAALRESVEEVGLALVEPRLRAVPMSPGADGVYAAIIDHGLCLDGRSLRPLSQWITPVGAPTRFDARFYLAHMEGDPALTLEPSEVVAAEWISPTAALAASEAGTWNLVLPTLHHLRWLATFPSVLAAEEAVSAAPITPIQPALESDGSIVTGTLPLGANLS